MVSFFLEGMLLGLAGAVMPGPFQTYLLLQASKNGAGQTLPAAFAPILSDVPIVALAVFILKQVPQTLNRGLHIAGGLFILYLTVSTLVKYRSSQAFNAGTDGKGATFIKAILMNALSPGPYLFWSLIAGPILLQAWTQASLSGLGFLLGFYGTMVPVLALLIAMFGQARRLGVRLHAALLYTAMLALTCFGIHQLYLGFFQAKDVT